MNNSSTNYQKQTNSPIHPPIAPEYSKADLEDVNEFNLYMMEVYLLNVQSRVNAKSVEKYERFLRYWLIWCKLNLNNKIQISVKIKDYYRFINWLKSTGANNKKIIDITSVINGFNKFIVEYYHDDYPTFKNFFDEDNNIKKRLPVNKRREAKLKQPLSYKEYKTLVKYFEETEDWERLAYLKLVYCTGCFNNEILDMPKDLVNIEPVIKEQKYRDEEGYVRTLELPVYYSKPLTRRSGAVGTCATVKDIKCIVFGQEVYDAIKKWVDARGGVDGDDCPYLFVYKNTLSGKYHPIGMKGLNPWFNKVTESVIGRTVTNVQIRTGRPPTRVGELAPMILQKNDPRSIKEILESKDDEIKEVFVLDTDDSLLKIDL